MAVKPLKTVSETPSNGINVIRDAYLWCMSAIYMFAFGSIYYQIPGLYGDNGILPAKLTIKPVGKTFEQNFHSKPTLVWMAPMLGLDVQLTVELIALAGVIVAFAALLFHSLRNLFSFALLWILYMSLYQVGQTFMWFQWDILLLEAGFLTILVSPLHLLRLNTGPHSFHTKISFWLIRWLLFRLMFASGVVKLTSMCPTWWQLTALNYHFESQCIPMPFAWYAHQFPSWILKLGVVGTYVVEIAVPFLFFSPLRALRLFSFYAQVLLQVLIILTGNYNFFNLLTIVLCISLLDDCHLTSSASAANKNQKKNAPVSSSTLSFVSSLVSRVIEFATYGALAYWTVKLFSIKLTPENTLDSKIAFTSQEFHRGLEIAVLVSIYVGAISLVAVVLSSLYHSIRYSQGCFNKPLHLIYTLLWTGVAFYIFAISMVPHTSVDTKTHAQMWPVIRKWHDSVDRYQLVNPYGLFRRMTGVGGRPEVVIEGSNSLTAGWKEYHFMYKTGNVSSTPAIVAPHQPRLDWQMWFAALGSYQQNPWFLSFVNRLLNGQQEVLDLLDKGRNPFPSQPPKYIRAILYTYQYTPWTSRNTANWWTRKKTSDYLPALSKDHQSLKDFLHSNNLIEVGPKRDIARNLTLKRVLNVCRQWICQMPAPLFLLALFTTCYTVKVLRAVGKDALSKWVTCSQETQGWQFSAENAIKLDGIDAVLRARNHGGCNPWSKLFGEIDSNGRQSVETSEVNAEQMIVVGELDENDQMTLLQSQRIYSGSQNSQGSGQASQLVSSQVKGAIYQLKEALTNLDDESNDIVELPKDCLEVVVHSTPSQLLGICSDLGAENLSYKALSELTKGIIKCEKNLSLGWSTTFLQSTILNRILSLEEVPPRFFLDSLTIFTTHLPRAVIDGFMVPCICDRSFCDLQGDILTHLFTLNLSSQHQQLFVKKALSECKWWNESTVSLMNNIMDNKFEFDKKTLDLLTSQLVQCTHSLNSSLKFGKFIQKLITSYGTQFAPSNFDALTEVLHRNQTFLKKTCLNFLKKYQHSD